MSDSQFNGKRLFAYQQPGRPAKYDIVGTHIREVGKAKPTYEIRGRYIYRANAIGQPVYEITDNLVYQHLIVGQPIYEIR